MNDPKSKEEIVHFVDKYNINLEECVKDIKDFDNMNDFFIRELKPGSRLVTERENAGSVCSPADCRLLAFPLITDASSIWIKGDRFTVDELIKPCGEATIQEFQACSLVISRLAPQDYHRWHTPVSGVQGKTHRAGDAYYTVNPIAVRTTFNIFTENKREVYEIETERFGKMILVAVGATAVGSIQCLVQEGESFVKGDEHGYFAFGGSTVLMLFRRGTIVLNEDLVRKTNAGLETLVTMGCVLGREPPGGD